MKIPCSLSFCTKEFSGSMLIITEMHLKENKRKIFIAANAFLSTFWGEKRATVHTKDLKLS